MGKLFPGNTIFKKALKDAFYEEDRKECVEELRRFIERKAYDEAVRMIDQAMNQKDILQPYVPCKELRKLLNRMKRMQNQEVCIQLCMGSAALNFSEKRLKRLREELMKTVDERK